jgi:RNA polymerase sigma-70 factor (ECF subfamily)
MNGHRSQDGRDSSGSWRRDDISLVERAKQGEKQAVGELYRRHVDVIYRYIFTRVRDTAVAEDLTAQVFLKAVEGLPSFQPTGRPFRAWLYRIAHARTVDHWRQQRRRQHVPLDDALSIDAPGPAAIVEAEAEWTTAIGLLAQLTDDQQDVLILRFIGEMSLSEVAATLGKTTGAVKATQHRALASLARLQQRQRGGDRHE